MLVPSGTMLTPPYASPRIAHPPGSVWTRDIARALRVVRAVQTGVISVNTSHSVHLELPFGGVKHSGIGRELGTAAMEHYSELKSVFIAEF